MSKSAKKSIFFKTALIVFYLLVLVMDALSRKLHLLIISLHPFRILFNVQYYLETADSVMPCLLRTMLGTLPLLGVLAGVKLAHNKAQTTVQMFLENHEEDITRLDAVYPATAGVEFFQKCTKAVSRYKVLGKRHIFLMIPLSQFRLIENTVELYEKMIQNPPKSEKTAEQKKSVQKFKASGCDFSALTFLERYYPGNPVSACGYIQNAVPDKKAQKEILNFLESYLCDVNAACEYAQTHDKVILRVFTGASLQSENILDQFREKMSELHPVPEHILLEQAGEIVPEAHGQLRQIDSILSQLILKYYAERLSCYRTETNQELSDLCGALEQTLHDAEQILNESGLLYQLLIAVTHEAGKNAVLDESHSFRKLQAICRKIDAVSSRKADSYV